MNASQRPARNASIWNRFWSPHSLLEAVPDGASPDEAAEIGHRNAVWLKTYMDLYILRWGALWTVLVLLAILAAGEGVPDWAHVLAIASAVAASAGLANMILIYRRAARSVQARAKPGDR